MQPDETKLQKHISYDDIYLDENGHWYRLITDDDEEESYQRTYPSWEKSRSREIILPDRTISLTADHFRLGQLLLLQVSQSGPIPSGGLRRKAMTDALAVVRGSERGNLKALMGLWRCGLVTREGEIFKVNERPYNQKWRLSERLKGAFK